MELSASIKTFTPIVRVNTSIKKSQVYVSASSSQMIISEQLLVLHFLLVLVLPSLSF